MIPTSSTTFTPPMIYTSGVYHGKKVILYGGKIAEYIRRQNADKKNECKMSAKWGQNSLVFICLVLHRRHEPPPNPLQRFIRTPTAEAKLKQS